MVRIESIHAQYPTGNCPVSLSKFFSFFPLQQWKGFRKKHLSKNSPHHSSIFITTNRYLFWQGMQIGCWLSIPFATNDFLSFSYPTRNVFQWASSTWLHIFWVERSEKLHGSDGRANESSWRERVSAMGKKYRVEKPRFFPPGWKDIDRLRDQKGISHYN